MNLADLHPSTSLKSADFDDVGEMMLTIRKVEIRNIGQEGEQETKPVLTFDETEKTLVLNKTNANLIGSMHGEKNVDVAWVGKQITLHVEMTTFQGKATPGIRVKQSNAAEEYWAYATNPMFLSPDEARAILKEHNGDFVAALASMKGEIPLAAAAQMAATQKQINAALEATDK